MASTPKTRARPSRRPCKATSIQWFRSFDLAITPMSNAPTRFIAELQRFEAEGEMPRLQIFRLPNDHTHGTTPASLTPTAQVADNDLGLGHG